MTAPSHLVFSDVDETLIRPKSMLDFLGYYLAGRYGPAGARTAASFIASLSSTAGRVPREQANRDYYRLLAGEPVAEVADAGARWYADRSARPDFYLASTYRALAAHRSAGAALVLVSGSFPAVLDPIAAEVGAAHVLCARLQERDGLLTGELVGAPMIGSGKRAAVLRILSQHPHISPADCHAFGDHESDLPMLAEVGHPVVVGADPGLLGKLPGARTLAAD